MTQDYSNLLNLLTQTQGDDFLRSVLKTALETLMDKDVSNQVNASLGEQTSERETYRNGYRERCLNTGVGSFDLKIPKIRKGSYFPPFLNHFQRTEDALFSVIQEAYIGGVSTRKMERVVQEMGIESLKKSQVSEVCKTIKDDVDEFMNAPIDGLWTYLYLDATYLKTRVNKRVVSKAALIAIGVNTQGERRVLGLKITDSEASVFWKAFLESLKARGLKGVELVISDAHTGLKEAIHTSFLGASWQRCWVHFMRNILSNTSKKSAAEVMPHLKSIMAFKTPESRKKAWLQVSETFVENHPKIAKMMEDAMEDVLAHTHFPVEHWAKIYTSNPIERLNKEIKRRTNCVGIFPNDDAVMRLLGAILIQQDEDWIDSKAFLKPDSFKKCSTENAKSIK
jgi:transposase-like protein